MAQFHIPGVFRYTVGRRKAQVAPRKTPDTRPEANLAEAAEKASLVIRGLQARLQHRPMEVEETPEDLERQLAQYFSRAVTPAARPTLLGEIRTRVIDGVADRIMRQWEQGTAIEGALVDRLIERLFDRLAEPIR